VKLTPHFNFLQKWRMGGIVPLLPQPMAFTRKTLPFAYLLIQTVNQTLICQVRLLIWHLSMNMIVIGLNRWICELFSRFNYCFFVSFSLVLQLFVTVLFHGLFLSATLKLLLHSVFPSLSHFCMSVTYAKFKLFFIFLSVLALTHCLEVSSTASYPST